MKNGETALRHIYLASNFAFGIGLLVSLATVSLAHASDIQMLPPVTFGDHISCSGTPDGTVPAMPGILYWDGVNPINCVPGFTGDARGNIAIGGTLNVTGVATIGAISTGSIGTSGNIIVSGTGQVGVGTAAPLGTVDIENGKGSATLCLNGKCSTDWTASYATYSTHCAATPGRPGWAWPTPSYDQNGNILPIQPGPYTQPAWNNHRTCMMSCPVGYKPISGSCWISGFSSTSSNAIRTDFNGWECSTGDDTADETVAVTCVPQTTGGN